MRCPLCLKKKTQHSIRRQWVNGVARLREEVLPTWDSDGYPLEHRVETKREDEEQCVSEGCGPEERRMEMGLVLVPVAVRVPPSLSLHFRLLRPAPSQRDDDAVAEHGEQVAGGGEHEGERVGVGRAVHEGAAGVGQEVHEGGAQEDASGELGPHQQEALVPPEEVGRHPAGEGANEEDHEAPYLDGDQALSTQVDRLITGVGVVAPAMAVDLGRQQGEEKR